MSNDIGKLCAAALASLFVPQHLGQILQSRIYDFFLFSLTKIIPYYTFVKGRFTLRTKNLLRSLRSCGIFWPAPLTNAPYSIGWCSVKKEKIMWLFSERSFFSSPYVKVWSSIYPQHNGNNALACKHPNSLLLCQSSQAPFLSPDWLRASPRP